MRLAFTCACLFLCLLQLTVRAEEKPDSRGELGTFIPEAIRLLEKNEHEQFLNFAFAPKDLEKISEQKPLPEYAKWFAEKRAETLVLVLRSIKGTNPQWNEEKNLATFDLTTEIANFPSKSIRFKKVENSWYFTN